jgi:hypothetical protein
LTYITASRAATTGGKPHNVHGIEVLSAALDHYPTSVSELTESSFDTNPPLFLEFDKSQRGQKIYLAGRWEIMRDGEKGRSGISLRQLCRERCVRFLKQNNNSKT